MKLFRRLLSKMTVWMLGPAAKCRYHSQCETLWHKREGARMCRRGRGCGAKTADTSALSHTAGEAHMPITKNVYSQPVSPAAVDSLTAN
jgi:hypothetical protein